MKSIDRLKLLSILGISLASKPKLPFSLLKSISENLESGFGK